MFTYRLDDDRLLRPYAESDADELYALIDANREMLSRWMPWAPGETLEGVREFIATTRRQLADDDGFQAAIVERGGRSSARSAFTGSIGPTAPRASATGWRPPPRDAGRSAWPPPR